MRISPIAIAAVAALSLSLPSQEQTVRFEIDIHPPAGDDSDLETGTWVPAPPAGSPVMQLDEFRIKMVGHEGGWARPILDYSIAESHESFPAWLTATAAGYGTDIVLYGAELYGPCEQYGITGIGTFQRWVNFAVTNGSGQLSTAGVGPWCQPFLTSAGAWGVPSIQESNRLWGATSHHWPSTSYGQVHASLWDLLRSNPSRTATFSAYAMLRYAIVEQAIYQEPTDPEAGLEGAAAFFQSNAWRHALHGGWLRLALQMFTIRSREVIKPPGGGFTELNSALNISQLPLAGISPDSKFLVKAPSEVIEGTYFLTNVTLAPGQVHTFVSPQATSPLMVRFRKVGGGSVTTEAFPTPTLPNPAAYTLTVPSRAKSGIVKLKDGGMTQFQAIGTVNIEAAPL